MQGNSRSFASGRLPAIVLLLAAVLFPCHPAVATPASYVPATWMGDLHEVLGPKRLVDISMPGTHNAATADIVSGSWFSPDVDEGLQALNGSDPLSLWIRGIVAGWSRTTDASITRQLEDGIRYLDLRVCRDPHGTLYTCHGLYATPVHRVIDEVRAFVDQHPREVVVLDFNHFHAMDADDHEALAARLESVLGPRLASASTLDLATATVGELQQSGDQVLVLYHRRATAESHPAFWTGSAIESFWPNQNRLRGLKDALDTEIAQGDPGDRFWVLQGIRTERAEDVIFGLLLPSFFPDTMQEWSRWTNLALENWLSSDWESAPLNIILLDYYERSGLVPMIIDRNLP